MRRLILPALAAGFFVSGCVGVGGNDRQVVTKYDGTSCRAEMADQIEAWEYAKTLMHSDPGYDAAWARRNRLLEELRQCESNPENRIVLRVIEAKPNTRVCFILDVQCLYGRSGTGLDFQ